VVTSKPLLWGGSLLQSILSFIELFCKRDLSFRTCRIMWSLVSPYYGVATISKLLKMMYRAILYCIRLFLTVLGSFASQPFPPKSPTSPQKSPVCLLKSPMWILIYMYPHLYVFPVCLNVSTFPHINVSTFPHIYVSAFTLFVPLNRNSKKLRMYIG